MRFFLTVLSILVFSFSSLAAEAREPAQKVGPVFIGQIQGHPAEVKLLKKQLKQALSDRGFAITPTPQEADAYLEGRMGFKNVWGDYKDSRHYRVQARLELLDLHDNPLWAHNFTKKSDCSERCFAKAARRIAKALDKRFDPAPHAQTTPEHAVPDIPEENIPPAKPLPPLNPKPGT